ncbi:PAS domain-containing protein [Marivivens niveibacter]|nr:PAS domain-containing protein [Marivivens niveibacter]
MDVIHFDQINTSHDVIADIEAYWNDMRGLGGLPNRATFDPARLDVALPYSFILERVTKGAARFRVSGQKVNEMMLMETRGMPLSCFFHNDSRAELAQIINDCFDGPAIKRLTLFANRGPAAKIHGKMILLPLAGHNGLPTRVMGAMITDTPPYVRSPKFHIADHRAQTVDRVVWTNDAPIKTKGPAQRPALRLIINNS